MINKFPTEVQCMVCSPAPILSTHAQHFNAKVKVQLKNLEEALPPFASMYGTLADMMNTFGSDYFVQVTYQHFCSVQRFFFSLPMIVGHEKPLIVSWTMYI